MSTNFTVVGGDLRIIKLAQMLANDGNTIYAYGVEKAEELKENENIWIYCRNGFQYAAFSTAGWSQGRYGYSEERCRRAASGTCGGRCRKRVQDTRNRQG